MTVTSWMVLGLNRSCGVSFPMLFSSFGVVSDGHLPQAQQFMFGSLHLVSGQHKVSLYEDGHKFGDVGTWGQPSRGPSVVLSYRVEL